MPLNPVQFAHSVCDEFLRYIFSAFPISDPDLQRQARQLLERPSSLDIPLVQGPYVSLSEAFAKGDPVERLARDGVLHPAMPGLIGYANMYAHQQRVLEAVKAGRHVLVATGTGSGKTESFLYPIVDDLLRQRDQGITAGLTAILVYPMNALANDQLERLRDVLGGTGVTFAQWVGTTPDTDAGVKMDRFESSSRDAYLAERRKRRQEAQAEDRAVHPLAPPEECCSEKAIRERKPRILITNYRQLEVLLTRLPDVTLFADAPLKYLVFDEAHTYDGATGAEVACLIRRLRLLSGKTDDEVTCIGTSATLSDPSKKEQDNEQVARRFASRFFGVDPTKVALVGETYVSRSWPQTRHKPAPPAGDGMKRLERLLEAIGDGGDPGAVKAIVEELTGQMFTPGTNWRDSVFEHLRHNEYAYQATEILKHPKHLDEAAWQTSQRIAPDRLPQGERATAELLCYLILGAAARKGDESLLRPKVHFFIRGLDEMVVAFDASATDPKPEVFLSLAEAKEKYGARHDDSFFPVLTCKSCGQHFFERHYHGLKFDTGSRGQIKDFTGGNATENADGSDNAVWATERPELGTRLVTTDRLLEEADFGPTARTSRWRKSYFCRQCGAMHREPSAACLADGCKNPEPLVPLTVFGSEIATCPSCNSPAYRIGGRLIEPIRKVQAVTVADVHILAQAMINAAPDGHKKLIIFADSRQDAAFQAGWMQDHARRIRLRHLMYSIIERAGRPLALFEISDGLVDVFRQDVKLIEALLPELTDEYAADTFGHDKWKNVSRAMRYMVLRELTTGFRRTDSLEAMGLARVEYEGLTESNRAVRDWAVLMGISAADAVNAISLQLDLWRRTQILFVQSDAIYSRYHAKDDPFIQAGLLPLREFRPEGLLLNADASNEYARGLLARNGASAVQLLTKKWAADRNTLDVDAAVTMLWELLTGPLKLLSKLTFRSQRDKALADAWQVNAEKVFVAKAQSRERCGICQRLTTRKAPNAACTRHHCQGRTATQSPDSENYDVWLMNRPFQMVSPEEHTAQVPGEVRNKIENDFKSAKGRTNCLVATPTLELGVNIGALDMALMRNVPPRSANYWQRAGRAGREERMAVVVTYCRRSNHDRYFFQDPLRILSGAIEAPAFNLQNPLMAEKHIRSAILSEILLRSRSGNEAAGAAEDVAKATFPSFIRAYLLDSNDQYRSTPTSTTELAELMAEIRTELTDKLHHLFAKHWPAEAADLSARAFLERTIDATAAALDDVLRRLHRRLSWARSTRSDLHKKKDAGLIDREEEQLLRRCDDYINSVVRQDRSTYTLTVLATEGFLPGYGVYDGGVTASARRGFARNTGPQVFDLSRANVVALREFVPGNRLYANRGTFYVARYHLHADEQGRIRSLLVDPTKGTVADAGAAGYGQSGAVTIDALPLTDLDLAHESRITEEENLRFSMPVSVLGRLRKRSRGGRGYRIGLKEVSHVRGQAIELVNVGEPGQVRAGTLGHLICSVCGAAKTPYAVPAEIQGFMKLHRERCGKDPTRLALSVTTDVDVLQFHDLQDQAAAINIGEALRTAAARLLDMGPDDLQVLVVPRSDDRMDLVIYDPMPGGSGLFEQMLGRWNELVATAKELLGQCPQVCETACYGCLKTFRNQFHHALLNRHSASELLDAFAADPQGYRDIQPEFEEQSGDGRSPSNTPEARLVRMLAEHHFPKGKCRERVVTSLGLQTEPDWFYEPAKVAVYLDGMSRALHGDPKTARRDQLTRDAMELDGYTVIVVQSRDLNDPEAMRHHLRMIATALGQPEPEMQPPSGDVSSTRLGELLALCDERCRPFMRQWADRSRPIPEVGFELPGDDGRVTAQAELAWPSKQVAVILPDRPADVQAFRGRRWHVLSLDDLADPEGLIKTLVEG